MTKTIRLEVENAYTRPILGKRGKMYHVTIGQCDGTGNTASAAAADLATAVRAAAAAPAPSYHVAVDGTIWALRMIGPDSWEWRALRVKTRPDGSRIVCGGSTLFTATSESEARRRAADMLADYDQVA